MPELPEVETVRRTMESLLGGRTIAEVEVMPDSIVFEKVPEATIHDVLLGARVSRVGRKGKTWWLELEDRPTLYGHLGMAGWIREPGTDGAKILEMGSTPWEDEAGRPRFLKMRLRADSGREIVFTDMRRLARAWLGGDPKEEKRLTKLGPDAWLEPMGSQELLQRLAGKKAPIKAILMDQAFVSGIGNWIADEVLYHSGVAPQREGGSLTIKEVSALLAAIKMVLDLAVNADADHRRYPENWLFHVRWGGSRGAESVEGQPLERITVGGRTTAWVPSRQR